MSQLLLDNEWIEETQRIERQWEPAEILPEPVLRPDAPWEGNQITAFGSVFQLRDGFRMYYMAYNRPKPSLFCMAVSDDGVRWERPKLGLVEFGGNKANNILWSVAPGEKQDGPTVCHDPEDAATPFKLMCFRANGPRPDGEYVAFSRDGINWSWRDQPVLTETGDRTNLLGTRDHHGQFVALLRHRDTQKLHRARTVWRSRSEDFVNWSQPQPLLQPDLSDSANSEFTA